MTTLELLEILRSSEDDEIEAPTPNIPKLQEGKISPDFYGPFQKVWKDLFDNKYEGLGCSYDGKYETQVWFNCETCFPTKNDLGVCLGCAQECVHKDHYVDSIIHYGSFFCDIGHGIAGFPDISDIESSDEEEKKDSEEEEKKDSEEEGPTGHHDLVTRRPKPCVVA